MKNGNYVNDKNAVEKGIMKYLKDYSVLEFQNLDDNKDVCTWTDGRKYLAGVKSDICAYSDCIE